MVTEPLNLKKKTETWFISCLKCNFLYRFQIQNVHINTPAMHKVNKASSFNFNATILLKEIKFLGLRQLGYILLHLLMSLLFK